MLCVEEAQSIVLDNLPSMNARAVPLLSAVAQVLAEDVVSEVDLPPFNKSAMDGYAVCSSDVENTPVTLDVIENIPAGCFPEKRIEPGQCAKIMTGAPVPEGADAVVMIEYTEENGKSKVSIQGSVKPYENICAFGEDLKKGELVLERGRTIRPQEVALLAATGRTQVIVHCRPKVSILATGSELAPPTETLGPGRIYDANTPCLASLCRQIGIVPEILGVAPDNHKELSEKIAEGLRSDVLLVSGGVSVGDYDLVPGVLNEFGFNIRVAKVAMKPGKPTVFATKDDKVAFGMPGNPVSSFVAFTLFVAPALKKMTGYKQPELGPIALDARLTEDVENHRKRRLYAPATLVCSGERWEVRPTENHGSADLVGLSHCNALMELPPKSAWKCDDTVRVIRLV